MKVFVVSTGPEYNWVICGIFSTKEKADEYVNTHGGPTFNSVEEHEVDVETK